MVCDINKTALGGYHRRQSVYSSLTMTAYELVIGSITQNDSAW